MKAMTKYLAGGVVAAALISAAPAAAQYPGYGYGYGSGTGGIVGQVLNSVIGGGYGNGAYGNGGYGANSQQAVSQCVAAVQARLGGSGYGGQYGGYGSQYGAYGSQYGYNGQYGNPYGGGYGGQYGAYANGRVLGISRVEPRGGGGLTVRGVANSGTSAAYGGGYGYNAQSPVDLTFKCKTDYRGMVTGVSIERAMTTYGANSYTPYGNDYSQYGYRRY